MTSDAAASPRRPSVRLRGTTATPGRVLGAALAAGLALALLSAAPAQAQDLDDQQAQLQSQEHQAQDALEFVDAKIGQTMARLGTYKAQLPGARKALEQAEGRVATATGKVESMAARVNLAEQSRDKINGQLSRDKAKIGDTRKMIGQIATQAYKSGGVPSNLSLLFGTSDTGDLAGAIGMANQALRSQTMTMTRLTQQRATNVNSKVRLAAVETEIKDLKAKADAALAAEQGAREAAAVKKAHVDKLVADAQALSDQLEAKKPQIQAQLARVQHEQDKVAAQIKERQRRQREAYLQKQREAAARAEVAGHTYTAPATGNVSAFGLRHPFAGNVPITSGWGYRQTPPGTIDFFGTGGYMHTGIDFGAPCGTPVYAAAAGTVTTAGWLSNGGGNTVMIDHGVLQGNALTTVYYHNSSVTVSTGEHVAAGQQIALSGGTGNSTGCHAHFETWVNGSPVNPMGLL